MQDSWGPTDWGPHYIVPSKPIKTFHGYHAYSGVVKLQEDFDEDILRDELEALNMSGPIVRVWNPWYYRKKNGGSWIRIGESEDREEYFAVAWDTTKLDNGKYEVLGWMHVFVQSSGEERALTRQNIVEVNVKN